MMSGLFFSIVENSAHLRTHKFTQFSACRKKVKYKVLFQTHIFVRYSWSISYISISAAALNRRQWFRIFWRKRTNENFAEYIRPTLLLSMIQFQNISHLLSSNAHTSTRWPHFFFILGQETSSGPVSCLERTLTWGELAAW